MTEKHNKEKFSISFQLIIRLLVFIALVTIIISVVQSEITRRNLDDKRILGAEISNSSSNLSAQNLFIEAYKLLPESSKMKIDELNQTQIVKNIQDQISKYSAEVSQYPQRKIREIGTNLLQNVYNYLRQLIEGK